MGKKKNKDWVCLHANTPAFTKKWECAHCLREEFTRLSARYTPGNQLFHLAPTHDLIKLTVQRDLAFEDSAGAVSILLGMSAARFLGTAEFATFADTLPKTLGALPGFAAPESVGEVVRRALRVVAIGGEDVDLSHSDTQTDAAAIRAQVLDQAKAFITQDRNSSYGDPEESFQKIAALWSVYFGRTFIAAEVAQALALLKLARLSSNPGHLDSWIDLAGYAACGAEVRPDTQK